MVLGLWFRARGLGSVCTGMHGDSVWGIMAGSVKVSENGGFLFGQLRLCGTGPELHSPKLA